jgi:hypothetical protein
MLAMAARFRAAKAIMRTVIPEECFAVTKAASAAPGPPARSQNQLPLTCRLQPAEVIDRQGPIPNMGEVELQNCSDAPLEIAYTMTPLQFLELEVIGPGEEVVSKGHFSDRFSPTREPALLRLLPNQKFTASVSLLATVPRDKRFPGTYTIQASYRFQGRKVIAAPLKVELPGEV